jgi:GNAT superfamily N-acetyltransferase
VSETGIDIRFAVPADRDVLVTFNRLLAEETEGKSLDLSLLQPGVAAVLSGTIDGSGQANPLDRQQPTPGRYLVACHRDRVVGSLMHTWEWSDWRNGVVWWLQSVYVEPDFRRRGIFRAMYEHLDALARADETVVGLRLYVERDNRIAQQTYATMGMSRTAYVVMEEMFAE